MGDLFGARYYDARTSVWQSPDPILATYLAGEGNGGVQNPFNLSLYSYSYQNPVKLSDPDGNLPEDAAKRIGKELLNDFKRGAMTAICMACVAANDTVETGKFIASAVSDPVGTFNNLQVVKDVKALGSSDDAVRDDAIGGLAYSAAKIVGVIAAGLGIKGKSAPELNSPNFIVSKGGTVYPVPEGAKGPTPVINKSGKITGSAFTGGKGGANGQVSTMRIMNPNQKNPTGYVKYENSAKPKPQGVDPYSGNTVSKNEAHHPLD